MQYNDEPPDRNNLFKWIVVVQVSLDLIQLISSFLV